MLCGQEKFTNTFATTCAVLLLCLMLSAWYTISAAAIIMSVVIHHILRCAVFLLILFVQWQIGKVMVKAAHSAHSISELASSCL